MLQQATMVLTDEQEEAVALLRRMQDASDPVGVAVIEGYAGCGKTSAVTHWLTRHAAGTCVAVAAPTHKAVNVLKTKAMGAPAEFASIHSLLGLRVLENRDGTTGLRQEGRNRLGEFEVCIIDECSMVDDELFGLILRGRGTCRVVFVGDPAQLPPVSTGQTSPTFTQVEARVTMRTVVRQAADNPIIRWSMLIRDAILRGQRVTLPMLEADLRPGDGSAIQVADGGAATITSLALSAMQAKLEQRVLAYRNVDVEHYNTACHYGLFGNADPFVPGEPVMCNDQYKIGLGPSAVLIRNSEEMTVVGALESDDPRAIRLSLERDDGSKVQVDVARDPRAWQAEISRLFAEYRSLKARADSESDPRKASEVRGQATKASAAAFALRERYAPIRHAYALTVHKSQGSTFDAVIIDWASVNQVRDAMEFNRMLYVAVTRPSKFLVVVR